MASYKEKPGHDIPYKVFGTAWSISKVDYPRKEMALFEQFYVGKRSQPDLSAFVG